MRSLLAAVALSGLFFLSTPVNAAIKFTEPNLGGEVDTFMAFWSAIAASSETVEIDSVCASACTFFLHFMPENRVCLGPHAALGFHQVSTNGNSNPILTGVLLRWIYPEWVQQWIKDHGGLKEEPIFMTPEDAKDHLKLCPGSKADSTTPDQLINHQDEQQQMP